MASPLSFEAKAQTGREEIPGQPPRQKPSRSHKLRVQRGGERQSAARDNACYLRCHTSTYIPLYDQQRREDGHGGMHRLKKKTGLKSPTVGNYEGQGLILDSGGWP